MIVILMVGARTPSNDVPDKSPEPTPVGVSSKLDSASRFTPTSRRWLDRCQMNVADGVRHGRFWPTQVCIIR